MIGKAAEGDAGDDHAATPDALTQRLTTELQAALTELARARAKILDLEALVDQDPLVPVLNRRGFMRELERALSYVSRYRRSASLVYIDLDGLKAVNDLHGHAAGDAVLIAAGQLLAAHVRRSDLIGRLGGDEFAVLLHEAGQAAATRKAEELSAQADGRTVIFAGGTAQLSFSWGVAELIPDEDAAAALARADAEMYRGKELRRSRAWKAGVAGL